MSQPILESPPTAIYIMRMDSNTCPFIPIFEKFKQFCTNSISFDHLLAHLKTNLSDFEVEIESSNQIPQIYLPCASEISTYASNYVKQQFVCQIRNNCATTSRKIMQIGSFVVGLTSSLKCYKNSATSDRSIIYIAIIDDLTGENDKEKEGFSNTYWFFGATNPLKIDDQTLQTNINKRFHNSNRNNGRSREYDWIESQLIDWFLAKNLTPGIYGLPRQKVWHKNYQCEASWLKFKYSISATKSLIKGQRCEIEID